jgi:hypothetical protein
MGTVNHHVLLKGLIAIITRVLLLVPLIITAEGPAEIIQDGRVKVS